MVRTYTAYERKSLLYKTFVTYPNDRKKSVFFLSTDGAVSQNSSRPCRTLERGADNFLMFGRGRRSDRITLGEPLGRAHGTLQPVWMKVSLWVITLPQKCLSKATCLQIPKKGRKNMARNDGVDRTCARNMDVTDNDIGDAQAHNEREKEIYSNEDIIPERSSLNVHFKEPTGSYAEMFEQMKADNIISTRGLKADAVHFNEMVFDVNSAYFDNHGGYEYARQFYEEAYKSAVEIVGGEQYILSAVMHADEINRAMSEALGKDVFHYHLHVVYVPVVEKQILWSKRCKDEALRGTVKETIMQVSRSKKWLSKPAVDKDGKPILQVNGKPVLRKSYSVLQDDFFQHMRAAGYTDVERGERDSTEEHLTVTQFKVAKEKQRLEAVTAELNQKEAQLDDTTQAAEKKKQELKSLQAQTKAATGIAVTVQELESMGKKSFTGNIVLTPDECRTLKNYAVSSFAEKAEKLKYQQKYETAKKDAGVWKKRYEKLLEQAQPYLDAVKLAPERVRAFLNAVLTRGKEKQDIPQERGRKRKESTIDR